MAVMLQVWQVGCPASVQLTTQALFDGYITLEAQLAHTTSLLALVKQEEQYWMADAQSRHTLLLR